MSAKMQNIIYQKRQEVSKRISLLQDLGDRDKISLSKFKKYKQKLIAELHTLDFCLGKDDNLDSDAWIEIFEVNNEK